MTTTRANPWRRRLLRAAAACLLLGAVTTVGVAWTSPWIRRAEQVLVVSVSANGQSVSLTVSKGRAGELVLVSTFLHAAYDKPRTNAAGNVAVSPAMLSATAEMLPAKDLRQLPIASIIPRWAIVPQAPGANEAATAITSRSGWPWPALHSSIQSVDRRAGRTKQEVWSRRDGELETPIGELPYWPVLPGFVLDTLFYAAAWWPLLLAPGFMRRWSRRRRNRCIACGYDVRGLGEAATCPECGA